MESRLSVPLAFPPGCPTWDIKMTGRGELVPLIDGGGLEGGVAREAETLKQQGMLEQEVS